MDECSTNQFSESTLYQHNVLRKLLFGRRLKSYQKLEHEASTTSSLVNPIAILISSLRQILPIHFLFLIICLSFGITILWVKYSVGFGQYFEDKDLANEDLKNVAIDFRDHEVYRQPSRPKELKYILLWTPEDYSPFYYLGKGQRAFIKNDCSMINCYVTTDRNFFGGDVTKFDAVAFNGRNLSYLRSQNLPSQRSARQKYIFFDMESSENYPVCDEMYDNFFNWTSTYKLDSDIPYGYILIRNRDGEIVGPRRDMKWVDMTDIDEELPYVQKKYKAAAWFASNCCSRSGREEFVRRLQYALTLYGLTVDIYGTCGPLHCPKSRMADCYSKLQRDYFFYLSLENSFAEDYVTEKLLTAVRHNVVPIVFGGANYSRFLPPGSYLDGRRRTPEYLAAMIAELINSREQYQQFFRWKPYYTYHDPQARENVCAVCAALNNKSMMESKSVYKDFRRWWNPNYAKRC